MKLAHTLSAMVVSTLLTGCASSTTLPSTYVLPAVNVPESPSAHDEMLTDTADPLLAMRALRLAPFLDVEGIVFQLDDVRLQEAGGHQWAESLTALLEGGIRDRLAIRLPQDRVMFDRAIDGETPALILRVEIDRFQGSHTGHAVVGGRWQLRDSQGEPLAYRSFDINTPLSADGYPALIRALAKGLDQLADGISKQAIQLQGR